MSPQWDRGVLVSEPHTPLARRYEIQDNSKITSRFVVHDEMSMLEDDR